MNIGILGSGMIARFHALAIQAMDGGTLHSVFGRTPDKTRALAEEFGVKPCDDLDAFLADPELDAVTIATPSGAHLEPALAAIRAGKHVICEKPLEVTPERIDTMVAAADEAGVVLAGIFNRRFHPAMEAFKGAVDGQRFGRLSSASAYIKWFRDQDYYDSGAWRGTWELDGGGALMNQGIHTIDQLIYLAGPVKSVAASTACLAHERIEVEDTAVAILEFESGARGVIEGSTACWSSDGHPARVQLCGTAGSVFLADEAFELWDFAEGRDEDEEIRRTLATGAAAGLGANDPKAINFTGHQRNFEDVAAAIREGRAPLVDGREARKAVALICAIYDSARDGGKPVALG